MTDQADVPVFTIPVVGYRQWLSIDGKLCPLFTCTLSQPWVPGVNRAQCFSSVGGKDRCPEPPHTDCKCGFHGRYDVTETMLRDHIRGRVTGAILVHGALELHHDGFRAEYARVVALAESEMTPNVSRLAEAYGVPLVPLGLLELEGGQYGERLPADLIPAKQEPSQAPKTLNPFAGPSDLGVVG